MCTNHMTNKILYTDLQSKLLGMIDVLGEATLVQCTPGEGAQGQHRDILAYSLSSTRRSVNRSYQPFDLLSSGFLPSA